MYSTRLRGCDHLRGGGESPLSLLVSAGERPLRVFLLFVRRGGAP